MTRLRSAAPRLAVALVFLVAFLWQVLGAVSNLLSFVSLAATFHAQLSAFALVLLTAGLAIPVVAFAGGLVAGRRSAAGPLALILLAALCASLALGVTQLAFFQAGIGTL